MTPGPAPVPPQILDLLSKPVVHHRTESFSQVIAEINQKLPKIFQTQMPCLTLSGWGTTGMEAALVNTLSSEDSVIVCELGKFGERWSEIALAYGLKVIKIKAEWGSSPSIEEIKKIIEQNKNAKAFLCQACETSTGVSLDIKSIGNLIKNTQMLFIVDGITALGAYNLPMDDWGIDVLVGGSQKAFMLPAGLSLISLSQKAWDMNSKSNLPRFCLDLKAELDANKKNQTQFSSATTHLIGLNSVLDLMLKPSFKSFLEATLERSEYFKSNCKTQGLNLFGKSNSPSLTVIAVPDDKDGEKIQKNILTKHNILIAGGQDRLKGKVLRVGHMGYISKNDLDLTLNAIISEIG